MSSLWRKTRDKRQAQFLPSGASDTDSASDLESELDSSDDEAADTSQRRQSTSTLSPKRNEYKTLADVMNDIAENDANDGPVELVCVPGFGGSRLMQRDEFGIEREIYPALLDCFKGLGWPSKRMIREPGDGSYASEVLLRIAHFTNWVPFQALKRLGNAEAHMWAYDWRRDVNDLGPLLRDWLLDLQDRRPANTRFVVIAHSYGGLVTLDALSRMQCPDLVKGVITLGTPFRGTSMVHPAMHRGYSFCGILPVYFPEVFSSFESLRFITPHNHRLEEWRQKIETSSRSVLSQTHVVCVSGDADTFDGELEQIIEGTSNLPGSIAAGDGSVTAMSATDPPGVEVVDKIVSQKGHKSLANCEESLIFALQLILQGDNDSEVDTGNEKTEQVIAEEGGLWTTFGSLLDFLQVRSTPERRLD